MNAKLLNPNDLAEHWGVKIQTLAKWRSTGIGPKYVKLSGRVRYRANDVDAYEKHCLMNSSAEKATFNHSHTKDLQGGGE